MHAIILDRNKQYLVKEGSVLKIDFLNSNIGDVINFEKILFFSNEDRTLVGDPFIRDKIVVSQVVDHIKDKKKIILKFKRRKHYMKKRGHRQRYTLLKIISFKDK